MRAQLKVPHSSRCGARTGPCTLLHSSLSWCPGSACFGTPGCSCLVAWTAGEVCTQDVALSVGVYREKRQPCGHCCCIPRPWASAIEDQQVARAGWPCLQARRVSSAFCRVPERRAGSTCRRTPSLPTPSACSASCSSQSTVRAGRLNLLLLAGRHWEWSAACINSLAGPLQAASLLHARAQCAQWMSNAACQASQTPVRPVKVTKGCTRTPLPAAAVSSKPAGLQTFKAYIQARPEEAGGQRAKSKQRA